MTLPSGSVLYNDKQLALVKRTVASDCNNDEFNLFIEAARGLGLNPLRNQIYAMVFNKDKPHKRRLSIIVSINALQSIAARSGDYLPSDKPTKFEVDESLEGPNNPQGLVSATVWVKKYVRGHWGEFSGTAYWDEFAPLSDVWKPDPRTGMKRPSGEKKLDTSGKWPSMPRHMLAKCAEAIALRKGWPEDLANVYTSDEVEQQRILDITPSEAAENGETNDRLERVGASRSFAIDWLDGQALQGVPIGAFADRAIGWIRENKDAPGTVEAWRERNRYALREFWAIEPNDALAVKDEIERVIAAAQIMDAAE